MKRPKLKTPSVFFCLLILSALALLLPDRCINYLSANSMDFPNHHYLLGILRFLSYQFMHAGVDHFKYNFLFAALPCLYLEKRLGKLRFLGFYLFAGVVSASVFMVAMSHSFIGEIFASLNVPMTLLGASGSIYGCMMLAAILWGTESIYNACISGLFVGLFVVPQVQSAILSLSRPAEIAYWGHVGGCMAALLVLPLFIKRRK